MISWKILKKTIGPKLVPTIGLCLVAYFCFHAVQGQRSIFARERLESEISKAHETLRDLETQRQHLEHQANLLMPSGLDLDLLEERIRVVLGYNHPDDVIILDTKPQQSVQD